MKFHSVSDYRKHIKALIFTPYDQSQPLSWSKKLTKSTENCYNIQEGRIVERGLKGRYISPIRIKNKHNSSTRSTSPAGQSITSIKTISTSTPTHQLPHSEYFSASQTLNWRILQRDKLATCNFDGGRREDDQQSTERLFDEDRGRLRSVRSEFSRNVGGYSVPYREKRNPLNSTRLSCYKPLSPDKKFDTLKNYKSVDDFLSLDKIDSSDMNHLDDAIVSMPFIASSKDLKVNNKSRSELIIETAETPKTNLQDSISMHKLKKHGITNKLRTMSGKTQKLFSKFYSNSNLKSNSSSSSDVCHDFILQRPNKEPTNVISSRRSLSYGTLPGSNEFTVKKLETEDGDSGILVNESGASSMVETDSSADDKTEIEQIKPLLFENLKSSASTLRNESEPETTDENRINIQSDNKLYDLSSCRFSNSTDQILSTNSPSKFLTKRFRNRSVDDLNEKMSENVPKRNSIVSEIVAMIEKNETKFNTMKNPRRLKSPTTTSPDTSATKFCAINSLNLCDDEKLKLKSAQSKDKICDENETANRINFDESLATLPSTPNFCTLPRRTKTSPNCLFLTVTLEKGPGKKSLGFTIVGGADSPRGALGIFIKSIMPNGQAIESGLLRAGDEILAVNGQVCHDLTHQNAVRMFKSVRSGEIVLNICRRKGNVCVVNQKQMNKKLQMFN
ncbi:CLUMA_CG007957, isoform A [Clunio marinus]|uniref:CLUMA_CG007957, isoform A n=1 Tax=Clunio marinus TaxID=568069 RepID=A0A1J1I3X8_9DIPT|nr:CLUMA_CG007957, isoform A [Clunio marinus]